jgi:hypothetical protein
VRLEGLGQLKKITLQTILAAKAHLAEGQLNIDRPLIHLAETRRKAVYRLEGQNLEPS